MKPFGALIIMLLITLMSGCSLFNRGCRGNECNEPQLLDTKPIEQYWYCYGNNEQKWTCKNEADASLIQPIEPTTR
ncbi:MAG: hypothetical protein WD002_04300 [Pseudomonadales bacterium]